MRSLALAILVVLGATLARGAQPTGKADRPSAPEPAEIENQKSPIENPLDHRRAQFDLRRRQALLDRCRERLALYQKELAGLGPVALPAIEGPDEAPDATAAVRRVTDRHGRSLYAIEADRATLQSVLEALATEARLDLLLDHGVSVRDLSAFLTVALDGVTLRQALDLVLGGFDLDFTLADNHLAITLPSQGPYRTAEERLRLKAESAYQAALVEFPNSTHAPSSHLVLGQYFHARQLHTQAIEQLGRLVRDYPRSDQVPAALFSLGESYRALGDLKNATSAYRDIVTQHPASPLAYNALLALARGHVAAREPAKAIPLLENALRRGIEPGRCLDASLLLTECLFAVGRPIEASTRLDSLLAGALPAGVERRARLLAARAFIDAGDYAKARAASYRLAAKFPATPEGGEARYLLAETYACENALLAAVEAYRGALAALPTAPQAEPATFRLAQLYQQMALYGLAIDTCQRLLAQGLQGARAGERQSAKNEPATPDAPAPSPGVSRRAVLLTLAQCCADQGDLLEAQRNFERAAEGARDLAAWQALLKAAHAALDDQRPADALPLLQSIADQAQDKATLAQALDTLGDCHRQLGRPDAALAAYRRAALAGEPAKEGKKD